MNANKFNLEIVTWQDAERDIRFVRDAVFVDELGIPSALEWDGTDADYLYVVVKNSVRSPVGTGQIGHDGQLGRLAVLPTFRGKGLGSNILDNLIKIAEARKLASVWLNAQTSATRFYIGLGFEAVDDPFDEAGISYIRMEKQLQFD